MLHLLLIDEALASKNALAIMNDAGLRANMAQRGRLAGAYMSYLAPVLIAGSVGNALQVILLTITLRSTTCNSPLPHTCGSLS